MDVLERNGWRALIAVVAFVLVVDLAGVFDDATSRAELPARTLTLWSVDAETEGVARLAAAAIREDAGTPVRVAVERLRGGAPAVARFARDHAGDPAHLLVAGSDLLARATAAGPDARPVAVLTSDRLAVVAAPAGPRTLDALYARLRAGVPTTVAVPRAGGTLDRLLAEGAARAARGRPGALRLVRTRRPAAAVAGGGADAAVDRLSRLRPAVARGGVRALAVSRGTPLSVGGRALPMFAARAEGPDDAALELRRWIVVVAPADVAQGDRRLVGAVVERATESSTAWWRGLRARRLTAAEVPARDAEEAVLRERASIARLLRSCASCSR